MVGHSVAGAFAGFIAAAVVIMLVAARKMWLAPGQGRFSPARLLVFMGGAVTYTGLINLALSYDSLLLRRFAGAALAGQGSKADALVGVYEAVRSLALLPYQALLVVTFVIFPLVSRSTFAEDREATRAYVRQTLRYALIFGAAMAVVLGARPATLLRIFYPAGYGTGAAALPILAAGVVALALLSIAGSIVTASGRPYVAVALVAITLVAGTGLAFTLVPRAVAGPAMLSAAAVSTAAGMLLGFLAALGYLWRRFGAGLPLLSVLRVLLATALAVGAARLVPGAGIVAGATAMALAGLVFGVALLGTREFGVTDREKFFKILHRKPAR
jgi:O-antigen/teichoic acid export membrane protein